MKPGFPIAPADEQAARPPGTPAFLATTDAEALIGACPRVAALLPDLADALESQAETAPGRLFDITDLSDDERRLLAELLGEGEVAATAALPGGVVAQIQESVLAGLWRVRFQGEAGERLAEYVEVASVPQAVRQAAARAAPTLDPGTAPADTMNVMPLLAEIADRMASYRPGVPSHVINFSLLPMTEADMSHLQARLGSGAVLLAARGYGACRVQATGARHVWSVQYSNAGDALVLDTLEIGDVPAAVLAAGEDFRESAQRLRELAAAYFA